MEKRAGAVFPRVVDRDAHGEHKGVGHAQIVPEDDIPNQVADVLLISGLMQPQPDGAVTEDHADDGDCLQKVQLIQARRPAFLLSSSRSIAVV